MSKFCSNCGSELNGNFCSNCGTKVGETGEGLSKEASEYINSKVEAKQNHNTYRTVVGIIMIILGVLIFIGSLSEETMEAYEQLDYNITVGFTLPGIATLVGGILSIISKRENKLLLISGLCYILAAVCNVCGIRDISLLFILSCIFAPINIVFFSKTEKK